MENYYAIYSNSYTKVSYKAMALLQVLQVLPVSSQTEKIHWWALSNIKWHPIIWQRIRASSFSFGIPCLIRWKFPLLCFQPSSNSATTGCPNLILTWIVCEVRSGNSTRLVQKGSLSPMVCLSNWQDIEIQRAGTAFLHGSWISLGQKPLPPFAKPYLRAFNNYFQFAHPKVAKAMLFIIMEN